MERKQQVKFNSTINDSPKNDAYGAEIDEITAAILFLERDRDKNKVDTKVEIKGTSFSIKKGI